MAEAWWWKLSCVSLFHWIEEITLYKKLFNVVCISTLINEAWIGVLAQLNEEFLNTGLLTPSTRKSYNISLPQPKGEGAKKPMKGMVHIFTQTIGETKLSSMQIKQDDTHTKPVKINDATTIKIVDKKMHKTLL